MEYTVDDRMWSQNLSTIELGKTPHPIAPENAFSPDPKERLGEIAARSATKKKKRGNRVCVAGVCFPLRPDRKGSRFFMRPVGWIRICSRADGETGYARVMRIRKSAIAACAFAVAAVALLAFSLASGVPVADAPAYLADASGVVQSNADAHATISYAAYESTPDQTWKAGETEQAMYLALPASVTAVDEEGEESSQPNPVVAAPHIYVDFDANGAFTEEECVFNPASFDDEGNVTDRGQFLEAGTAIDQINLTRPIEAGTYAARTTWSPMTLDGAEANPMSFDWQLTVE